MEPLKRGIVFRTNRAGAIEVEIHEETLINYLQTIPQKPGGWRNFILLENTHQVPGKPSHRLVPDVPEISHRNYQTK